MPVQSLGREDPLEEGTATPSSVLAWTVPWTGEPGGLQSMGSWRVRHNGSDLARTHVWNRKKHQQCNPCVCARKQVTSIMPSSLRPHRL